MFKKIIKITSIFLFANTAFAQLNLNNGLVAYYPFNGNANDASGNSNNGILNGCTFVADRNGIANRAIQFNGTSDFIRIPKTPSLSLTTAMSFSVWIKPSAFYNGGYPSNFNQIFTNGNINNETCSIRYSSDVNTSGVPPKIFNFGNRFTDATNSGVMSLTSTSINLNTNYHLVCIFTGNEHKIYINGVLNNSTLISTNKTIAPALNSDFYIGKSLYSYPYDHFVNGVMDEVRIYNRVLQECEIKELFQTGGASLYGPVAPIIAGNNKPCLNVSTTYNVTNAQPNTTYEWSGPWQAIPPHLPLYGTSVNLSYSNLGASGFSVKALNSCGMSNINFLLTVTNSSLSTVGGITGPTDLCLNSTAIYKTTSSANSMLEWSLVSGTPTQTTIIPDFTSNIAAISFVNSGINQVRVRASNVCGSTNYSTLNVNIKSALNDFIINGPSQVCPNDVSVPYSITAGATPITPDDRFYWIVDSKINNNMQNGICNLNHVSFPNTSGATYNLSVTAAKTSCSGVAVPVTKTVTVKIGPDTPVLNCIGGTGCPQLSINTPSSGTTIDWYINDVLQPSLAGQTLITRTPDVQTKVRFTKNGCNLDAFYFYYAPGGNPCGGARMESVEGTQVSDLTKVYPNPNTGTFIIETDGTSGDGYIINSIGKIIDQLKFEINKSVYNATILESGMYLIRIKTSNTNKSFKVIVK